MLKLVGLLVICALLGACQAQTATAGDFPAHVALHIVGGRIGEGVIVNQNHVLTVAQNVFDPVDQNVRLAPADITVSAGIVLIAAAPTGMLPIIRIFAHDHYNFHTGKFNVAVLRMTNNFLFTPNEPRPFIRDVVMHNRIVPDQTNCQLVGFLIAAGTQNRQLQGVNQPVLARETCNAVDNPAIRGRVFDQNICVGQLAVTANNCAFNDGAAYYCNGELVGLRTIGLACNAPNSPAVLVQTRWFQDWIPQQFTRTDNPAPGVVPPPGIGDGDGAATVILSTVALVFAVVISLMNF